MKLRSLYWKITAPVMVIALAATLLISIATPYMLEQFVTKSATNNAEQLLNTFRGIRDYYSEFVVEKVTGDRQFHLSAQHQGDEKGIPVPATFLMEMMDYDMDRDVITTDLISPYPFANRQQRTMDDFQQRAWQAMMEQPDQFYVELVRRAEQTWVRVAQADKLSQPACVNCHNNHPSSLRHDWQLGDVRGILEVNTLVDDWLDSGVLVSRIVTGLCLLAFALIAWVNWRTARQVSTPLASISHALRRLSQGSEPEPLPASYSYREIEELGSAFDSFGDKEQQRKQLADEVERLAYFDSLTELPNHTQFIRHLKQQLTANQPLEVALLDIDQFRDINDTLGYSAGDSALDIIARRIRHSLPEQTFVARMGEDVFGIACQQGLEQQLARVRSAIAAPIDVQGQQVHLNASAGVTQASAQSDAHQLQIEANIALRSAKESGKNRVVKHQSSLSQAASARAEMVRAITQGLKKQQFCAYFQPQFDLDSGELIGAEALVRWHSEDGQVIAPGAFIALAEQSRQILPIGQQVLNFACQACQDWQQQGLEGVRVAVNIASVQFTESDLISDVQQALTSSGLAPQLLELEVTESAMLADLKQVITTLEQLRAMNIELALDDFGTGYSSLSYLKSLPVDRLKIDRAFVSDVMLNYQDQAILQMIVELGQALGLKILAEGIETEQQRSLLKDSGCHEAQGFFYAKPLPLEQFIAFAQEYRAKPRT